MRILWTLFFLGTMLVVGADVLERRDVANRVATPLPPIAGDPAGAPTPKPGL